MKKYISASLLILFTLALAVCGLFLPSVLMDRQQQSLFDRTETIHLPVTTDSETQTTELTPEEFFTMAISYGMLDTYPFWQSYESTSQQLTTEYLIQTAHQQIKQLCELGILPDIFADTNYTWENVEYGTTWSYDLYDYMFCNIGYCSLEIEEFFDETSEGTFSGWIVYAGNNNLNINVVINAASGKIIKLTAAWYDGDDEDDINNGNSGNSSNDDSDDNSGNGDSDDNSGNGDNGDSDDNSGNGENDENASDKTTGTKMLSSAQIQKQYLEYLNLADMAQISQKDTTSESASQNSTYQNNTFSFCHFPDYHSQLVVNLCHYRDAANYEIALLEKAEKMDQADEDYDSTNSNTYPEQNFDSAEFNYHTLEIFFGYEEP